MSWTPPSRLELSLPFHLDPQHRVFSTVIERWVEHDPDRECYVQDDGVSVTYAQVNQRASAVAAALRAQGLGVGDRVVTLTANDIRVVYVGTALSKIGAVEVPVNPALVGASLKHLLADAAPKAVIVAPQYRDALLAALPEGAAPMLFEAAPEGGEGSDTSVAGPTLDEMLADDTTVLNTGEDIQTNMAATIMYTSGTTGLPKGAVLPHHHCYLISQRTAAALTLEGSDTLMSILPLFHAAGRYMNVGASFLSGARCGYVRAFSGKAYFDQARQFGATAMHSLLSVGHFLMAQPPSPKDREHSITRGLLAPCPPSMGDPFTERFGIRVFEAYASTESNITVFNFDGPKGACGKAYAPYRLRIVDAHDRELPTGEIGEIVVSSDEPWSTFTGYLNQPETTLETIRNFGLHTGDAGHLDENGYLWFSDRIKDMIRRRGENVAALTVESVVNTMETVAESAAYPLPSPFGEEEIAIAVTFKAGHKSTAAEVVEFCREHLPRFAVPRYVRFLDEIPKTETGKIQKFKLKKLGTDGTEDIPEVRK